MLSRFSSIWPHDCTETGNGNAEDQDWISYRCEGQGGVAVHLLFNDSNYLHLQFGQDGPLLGPFMASRESNWPMEWRGRVVDGRFVPHASIARMTNLLEDNYEGRRSYLVVFDLRGNACVVGETFGARANEEARRLADAGGCRPSEE